MVKDELDRKENTTGDLALASAREDLERLREDFAGAAEEHGPSDLGCLSLEEALRLVDLEDPVRQ